MRKPGDLKNNEHFVQRILNAGEGEPDPNGYLVIGPTSAWVAASEGAKCYDDADPDQCGDDIGLRDGSEQHVLVTGRYGPPRRYAVRCRVEARYDAEEIREGKTA